MISGEYNGRVAGGKTTALSNLKDATAADAAAQTQKTRNIHPPPARKHLFGGKHWKNVNLDLSASTFPSIMNFEFPDLYFEKLDRGGKDRLWMRREGGQLGQKGDNLLSDLGLEGIRNHLGLEGF